MLMKDKFQYQYIYQDQAIDYEYIARVLTALTVRPAARACRMQRCNGMNHAVLLAGMYVAVRRNLDLLMRVAASLL